MDLFLTHLVHDLELENFGVTYEVLVPITCTLKWTRDIPSVKDEFISVIMKYLLPRSNIDEEYLNLQSRIRAIVELYWKDIVEENIEFRKIKT